MKHADILSLWPSLNEFAADLGITHENARQMRSRSRIPRRYWEGVHAAARRRRLGLRLTDFIRED